MSWRRGKRLRLSQPLAKARDIAKAMRATRNSACREGAAGSMKGPYFVVEMRCFTNADQEVRRAHGRALYTPSPCLAIPSAHAA